jgi:hypothetical protein
MNNEQTIVNILKRLVNVEKEHEAAKAICASRKKDQEKLKELFEEAGIEQYVLDKDGYHVVLSFKKSIQTRVDVASLPESIRDLYVKQTIAKREILNIINIPE